MSNLPFVVKSPRRIVLFGDSIMTYDDVGASPNASTGYSARGIFNWANILMGQKFKRIYNAGIGGNTTAQMLARIKTDVLDKRPDICFILGGENDFSGGVSLATTQGNLDQIYKILANAGIIPILATMYVGESGWANSANILKIVQFNAWLREYAYRNGLLLCDLHKAVVNPSDTTGYAIQYTADPTDHLHPSAYGAYLMGKEVASVLSPLMGSCGYPVNSYVDCYGQDSSSTNVIDNPTFTGTGGTKDASTTGTVADGYSMTRFSGSATCVGSIVSSTAGTGNAQQFVISSTSGASVFTFTSPMFYSRLSGDTVYTEAAVRVVDSGNILQQCHVATYRNAARISNSAHDDNANYLYFPQVAWQGIMRTNDAVFAAGAGSGQSGLRIDVNGAGTATIEISNFACRKSFLL